MKKENFERVYALLREKERLELLIESIRYDCGRIEVRGFLNDSKDIVGGGTIGMGFIDGYQDIIDEAMRKIVERMTERVAEIEKELEGV